ERHLPPPASGRGRGWAWKAPSYRPGMHQLGWRSYESFLPRDIASTTNGETIACSTERLYSPLLSTAYRATSSTIVPKEYSGRTSIRSEIASAAGCRAGRPPTSDLSTRDPP